MITRTLLQLRTSVRQRCDMENTTFVTDAEVSRAVTFAGRALFALLVKAYGEDHFSTESTIATVNGTYTYALPTTLYRLLELRVSISGEDVPLQRGTPEDMLLSTNGSPGWVNVSTIYYQLRGQNLRVAPAPLAVHTITVRYVTDALFFDTGGSALSELSADTNELRVADLLWEDFVITHAAIRCKRKEEGNTSDLKQDLSDVAGQIMVAAMARDQHAPTRVRMVM